MDDTVALKETLQSDSLFSFAEKVIWYNCEAICLQYWLDQGNNKLLKIGV